MLEFESSSVDKQDNSDSCLLNIRSRIDIHPVFFENWSACDARVSFEPEFFSHFDGLNTHETFAVRHAFGYHSTTHLIFSHEMNFSEQNDIIIGRFSKASAFLLFALHRYAKNTASWLDLTQRFGIEEGKEFTWLFQIGDTTSDTPGSIAYQRKIDYKDIILFPDEYFMITLGYDGFRNEVRGTYVPWTEREAKAFWRGSSTGLLNLTLASLSDLPRYKLCAISCLYPDLLDAGITDVVQTRTENDHAEVQSSLIEQGIFKQYVPQSGMIRYKYLIDVDGNANSWGLFNKFLMGGCVLKIESEWEEWYYSEMQPWIHYVPILADMSDLAEKIEWCRENDDKAKQIAKNGMAFASRMTIDSEMRKVVNHMFSTSGASS